MLNPSSSTPVATVVNDKGDVRLDTNFTTLAGDDVLVPGDPEASSLYWTTTLPLDDELFYAALIKNEEKDLSPDR